MKRKMIAILLFLIFSHGISWAAISTEELARKAQQGQALFNTAILERDSKVGQIMADLSTSPPAKELAVRNVQKEFLKQSREMHLKYREPFIRRVIAETNATLPEGKKIQASLGSDIYQRHKVTGRVQLDKKGRKILNPKHRGMQGDLDLGGNPQAVKRLEGTFDQYKHLYLPETPGAGAAPRGVVTSNTMDAPGSRDFGDVEVTINMTGEPDLPDSSAHQTRVQMDAFSKETYVSFGMRKNQAGRSLVETNDHIKKAAKGFAGPPSALLGSKGEKPLQGMSKGTLNSIDSGTVSDAQLSRVLRESGYEGNVTAFKHQLKRLKKGHLHQGVGLNDDNIEAFQKACRNTTDQALGNARQQFDGHKAQVQARIDTYDAKIKSGELSGDQLERHKKVSQQLKNDLVDSKVKIEQTGLANKVKIEGGSYDDYFQKNALTNVTPIPSKPKMTRMQAVKNGLKPGILDVDGYGWSAYNVYDNITRMQKGEISQNDAVIGITTEVIDTGFGIITDVGTAAAIGSIGTGTVGAVATVGAPLVVVFGAGYTVSAAVEEGLRTYEAFKVEEISEKIAKSKKEEVINTLQLQAEELLKAAEASGDWRFFSKADDIANSLERMHQVTGDDDFKKTFETVYNRVDRKKDSLEAKYNCSIYALKGKMEEEKAVVTGPVELSGSLTINLSQGSDFDRGAALHNGQTLPSKEGKLWAVSMIPLPESAQPVKVQVVWELLNESGTSLGKKSMVYEGNGGQQESFTKIPISALKNGRYTIVLTQSLADNPREKAQTQADFVVKEFVRIRDQWVTTKPGDIQNKIRLMAGDIPHLYVTFDMDKGLGSVQTEFSVVNKKTGKKIYSIPNEYIFSPDKEMQRTGIRLPEGLVKPGDTVTFVATISPPASASASFKPVTSSLDFSIISQDLKIRASRTLAGDQYGNYSITVPDGFERPFTVRIGGGGLEVRKSSNPLRGKFRGTDSTSDSSHTLSFLVKDANGRIARGKATVKVRGLDPKTLASKNRPKPTLYAAPPPKPEPAPAQATSTDNEPDFATQMSDIMNDYNKEIQRIQKQQQANTPTHTPTMPKPATLGGMSKKASTPKASSQWVIFIRVKYPQGYRGPKNYTMIKVDGHRYKLYQKSDMWRLFKTLPDQASCQRELNRLGRIEHEKLKNLK